MKLSHIAYQAIVDLPTGMPVGYEALARFEDGVTPNQAFARARDTGQQTELELTAVELALDTIAPYLSEHMFVSVNVSPETITDRLAQLLLGRCDGQRYVHPRQIMLEVTENAPIKLLDMHIALREFYDHGGKLALDDVGIGFSGLFHLIQINPAALKIDRSLLNNVDVNSLKQDIVHALVVYGERSRTMVIAEGVETHKEQRWLRALGVRYMQGFLYHEPSPISELPF